MKEKIVCIFVCLLFIITIPTVAGTEQSSPVGFRQGKVYGLFPSVSDDGVTCFLIGPFLRWATLS